MGCISIKDLSCTRAITGVRFGYRMTSRAHCTRVGRMSMSTSYGARPQVGYSRINRTGATFGLVCSVHTARRLNVDPDNIWLMPENLFTDSVVITSNVVWHIEQ